MHYLSLLSTIITLIFTIAVLSRYTQRGGTHLLLWGIGLALYGLGTLSEVILGSTFNEWVLKLWYLSGAMLTAAWLGQGTLNLLIRRKSVILLANTLLLILSILSLVLIVVQPVDAQAAALYDPTMPASAYNPALPTPEATREGRLPAQYQVILGTGGLILVLTILLNIYGTLTLVGGALYSSYLFLRKNVLANRMIGNILIAAGGLFPAMGGTFVRAGMADWLYISEFVGVILMFMGFLQATARQPVPETELASAD
jgi:hypothetical protein